MLTDSVRNKSNLNDLFIDSAFDLNRFFSSTLVLIIKLIPC